AGEPSDARDTAPAEDEGTSLAVHHKASDANPPRTGGPSPATGDRRQADHRGGPRGQRKGPPTCGGKRGQGARNEPNGRLRTSQKVSTTPKNAQMNAGCAAFVRTGRS